MTTPTRTTDDDAPRRASSAAPTTGPASPSTTPATDRSVHDAGVPAQRSRAGQDVLAEDPDRPETHRRRRPEGPELPLGALLVAEGLLTPEQLEQALVAQRRSRSRLGDVLVASGAVARQDLYRLLARAWGRDFVDVPSAELDPALAAGLDPSDLVAQGWLPVRREPDGCLLVACAERPTPVVVTRIEQALAAAGHHERVAVEVTSGWDVSHGLMRLYGADLVDEAANGLWRRDDALSARRVLDARQRAVAGALLLATAAAVVLAPRTALVVASTAVALGFGLSVLFKFVVCMAGARRDLEPDDTVAGAGATQAPPRTAGSAPPPITAADVADLRDEDLPVYTVLVPVYREANIVADLIDNLGGLDYPADKLEILLLLEEEDEETLAAARGSRCPETVTFVRVPRGGPQTKPKACNVGLFFARGEHLVIYDAEDRPDPDQLKRAVIAFRRAREQGDESLVCVQAALNYWNAEENALTRMFTLEYSFWFDYMLPGLDAHRLPIPLGGTSNHFRTTELRRLGGWDPHNVTEDADLGIRAAASGLTVGVIRSTTMEEANRAYGNWVRQRSRWIKGYMQTTLVHLRHPRALVRETGLRQALGFAALVGGTPLSFLLGPPLYAVFLASLVLGDRLDGLFPGWVLWVSLGNLLVGNGLMVYVSMLGAFRRRRHHLVPWALANPLYWLLHAVAAYKALWQLVTRPHYWEKTNHGLSDLAG